MPSSLPSGNPVTSIPSASPSLSGWRAEITASSPTTSDIEDAAINDYASDIANYYGVPIEDVQTSTAYETSGTLTMTIPDDVPESDVIDAVTISIAETLGVHPSNVEVVVDMETGEVEYIVSSNSFLEAAGVQYDLENTQFQEAITESIEETLPSVSTESITVSPEITATMAFVVDADDARNDLTQAAYQTEELLSGFDMVVESTF